MTLALNSIEHALSHPGAKVAAWEAGTAEKEGWLRILSVEARPVQLVRVQVPGVDRQQLTDGLRRKGVRIGAYDNGQEFFWCADEHGFALWSASRLEMEGKEQELQFADGHRIPVSGINSVVSFVDASMVHRGVRLDVADGSDVTVVDEEDSAPLADPTYNVTNLSIDASWAWHLGAALATWLNRPHVNQIP